MSRPQPRGWAAALVLAVAMAASPAVAPAPASAQGAPAYRDPAQPVEVRVDDLLARMTLDDKLGQMAQAERAAVQGDDIARYRLGSLLSGGGSAPTPNTAAAWADMYDGYQAQALSTPLGIPLIYGIDAVHGHNNVYGATIFPHNVGLGATRDPQLVERIGRAVAEEIAGTGIDWDFAPCLCVARNDRWGRTYESFGELPELATSMSTLITGLQGESLGAPGSILATAKHYVADGGTAGGVDQGDAQISEAELRALHLPPFRAAVERGVGSVMVSYSSWNGAKLHAHRYLVSEVLKGELGFDGFVVSDWQGVDQIDGQPDFTAAEVAAAINAGVDMVMVPNDYQRFLRHLRAEVEAGRVPLARIDDANRRILRKKFELGLFERPFTERRFTSTVGSPAHRALARDAVRRSQVLLRNRLDLLPLPPTASRIFVAGRSADDIGYQSGGWTISWQGGSGPVTPGTTILQGVREAVSPATEVVYEQDGHGIDGSFQAAIAVVGEPPYAEFFGDRRGDLRLDPADLATIARLRASGVPLVVVLVSGRPLNVTAELEGWDALVAAWLPGTEGGGVADVLFGAHEPSGHLPLTWMRDESQQPINDGDGQDALFPYGYGLGFPASQDAYDYVGAVYYDDQRGTQVEPCSDTACGRALAYLTAGDYVGYADVDFGSNAPAAVQTRLASGAAVTGTIEYHLDSPTGPVIARVDAASTGGWQNWTTTTTPTQPVTGVHDLYLTFSGPTTSDFVNVNWLRFLR